MPGRGGTLYAFLISLGDPASKPAVQPAADGVQRRRPSGADPVYVPLGPALAEDEGDHLRRVADELGAVNLGRARDLKKLLRSRDAAARWSAAAELGQIGGREAVSALRELLEGTDPVGWEVAVHGLRHSRERDGWLCLESVALECVSMLASDHPAVHRPAAMRLLMMGRTKTMDRLFRAVDGHSRAIPRKAAVRFVRAALLSLPSEHARIVALRLGVSDGAGEAGATGRALTPAEAGVVAGMSAERVRELEAEAWAIVQSPRPWSAVAHLVTISESPLPAGEGEGEGEALTDLGIVT
jgi:hypothetical protein